jgi:hypothetical protein
VQRGAVSQAHTCTRAPQGAAAALRARTDTQHLPACTLFAHAQVGLPVLGVVENMSGLQQRLPAVRFVAQRPPAAAAAAPGGDAASGSGGAVPVEEDVSERVRALLVRELGLDSASQLVVCTDVFQGGAVPGGAVSGAQRMCDDMGVALLGKVPLDPALGLAAEQGRSVFAKGDDGAPPPVSAAALGDIVAKIVAGAAATRAQ